MIDLARMIDAQAREARKIYNAQDEIKKQAYADIAKARFAIEGASSYPDATFTLRLSYGTVRGYEQDGKQIPRSPILPVYISGRPNTTTGRHLICRNVGSTKNRTSIWRRSSISFPTPTSSAATAAVRW
jgi:Peptidase S46.